MINDYVQNFDVQAIYNIVVFLRYTDFWINCTSLKYSGQGYFTIRIHIGLQMCGHCVICSSSIWRFWLPLWYLQTLLAPTQLQIGSLEKTIDHHVRVKLYGKLTSTLSCIDRCVSLFEDNTTLSFYAALNAHFTRYYRKTAWKFLFASLMVFRSPVMENTFYIPRNVAFYK